VAARFFYPFAFGPCRHFAFGLRRHLAFVSRPPPAHRCVAAPSPSTVIARPQPPPPTVVRHRLTPVAFAWPLCFRLATVVCSSYCHSPLHDIAQPGPPLPDPGRRGPPLLGVAQPRPLSAVRQPLPAVARFHRFFQSK
jgi:hypothetical protein